MNNSSSFPRSRVSTRALALLAISVAPLSVFAQTTGFNQTVAGPWDYDTTGNWVGGSINGIWDSSLTLAATQAVTFDSNLILATGLSFGHAGNFALTLRGDGTNRTITLGGDISVATTGGTTANVTLGGGTNQNLNINLGGATRTLSVAASRTLTLTNVVSNGAINKTGAGTLTLSSANLFAGGITLDAGTLMLGNNAALGTGALTINGGVLNVTGARATTNNNAQNWNGDFTYGGANTLNTGTGAVTINGDRTVTVSGSTLTVGGAIGETGGSRSLTKAGAGTMILNGANTYSGGTVINGGILQFGAVPSTGDITINSGGTLNANNALANVTAWLGKITTDSSGVLALTGSSSENLDFTNHGNLMLGATTASTYSGALTPGGTTYRLGGGTEALTVTTALTGSGNSLVVGPTDSAGTTVILTGTNIYTGATTINSGSLVLAGATGSSASSVITANSGSTLAFDSGTAGVTGITRAASVSLKGASLNVTGNSAANSVDTISGALTVSAPSTWGGIGASTVTVTADPAANARLSAASLVRANNNAVFFRGTNLGANTIASNTAGVSNIEFATAPTAQLVGGGGAAGTQNISIIPWAVGATTASGVPTSFVTYDANGIRTLASGEYDTTIIAGSTTTNNIKLDGTSLTTNGATLLTINGATTVNSLFLTNGTTSTSGQSTTIIAGTGALTVTSGAIYMNFANGSNSNVTQISKPINFGTAEGVIGTMGTANSKTLSFTGGISGSGGLTIYDAGTTVSSTQAGVNFGAANSYTGDTIINGTLIAANPNALPNFANSSRTGDVYVNGTLGLSGSTNSTIRMNGLFGNGRIITPFSNNETLIVGDGNATSTFGGTITQTTGAIILTKIGTGTLNLAGTSSSYTGATNIQNGTLSAVTLNSVSVPSTTSSLGRPVTIATGTISLGATTTTGTLKVVGTGETTDRVINLAGTTGGGVIEQGGTGLLKFTSNFTATGNGSKTLTLSGSTAGTGEIAGSIVNGVSATSLAKTGTGTWILSGDNTYGGGTSVSAGSLFITNASGSATGTGAVVVASGATFGGTGTSSGLVTASAANSTFVAGGLGSIGTLNLTGGFAAASGATFSFEINGASVDTINFGAGSVSMGGTATFNFTSLGSVQTGSAYSLFAGSGNWSSVSSTFAITAPTGFVLDSSFGGGAGYVFDAANHTMQVQFASAVPEPSTFALLGGLGALAVAGLRRRKLRIASTAV